MEALPAQIGQTRRYALKWWARGMFLFFALIGVGIGSVLYAQTLDSTAQNPWTMRFFSAGIVLAGIYFGLSAFFYFVSLDEQSVSSGGMLRTRTLRRDSVKGRRTISNRYGSYLVIEGKNPEDKRLTISNHYNLDGEWAAWMQDLPDLDEQDRQAVFDAIASSQELGDSADERLQKLKQAKTIAIALSALAICIALALGFAGSSMSRGLFGSLDLVLALLPWIALLLQMRSPMLYVVFGAKKDPRATLLFVLLAAAFGLLASPFGGVHYSSPSTTLLAFGCVPGLVLGIALYSVSPKGSKPMASVLYLFMMSCFYGYGVVTQVNTQLDSSAPETYTTQVLDKTTSSGRSTTYYLHLNSWDPVGEVKEVSVSSSFYNSVDIGDPVCIAARDGALHIGWYTVQDCR